MAARPDHANQLSGEKEMAHRNGSETDTLLGMKWNFSLLNVGGGGEVVIA